MYCEIGVEVQERQHATLITFILRKIFFLVNKFSLEKRSEINDRANFQTSLSYKTNKLNVTVGKVNLNQIKKFKE